MVKNKYEMKLQILIFIVTILSITTACFLLSEAHKEKTEISGMWEEDNGNTWEFKDNTKLIYQNEEYEYQIEDEYLTISSDKYVKTYRIKTISNGKIKLDGPNHDCIITKCTPKIHYSLNFIAKIGSIIIIILAIYIFYQICKEQKKNIKH